MSGAHEQNRSGAVPFEVELSIAWSNAKPVPPVQAVLSQRGWGEILINATAQGIFLRHDLRRWLSQPDTTDAMTTGAVTWQHQTTGGVSLHMGPHQHVLDTGSLITLSRLL